MTRSAFATILATIMIGMLWPDLYVAMIASRITLRIGA